MNIEPGFAGEKADYVELPEEDAHRARRRRWMIIGAAVAIALIAVFFLRGGQSTDNATPPPPSVTVVVPGRQMVSSTVSATGSLAARREMPVGVAGEGGMVTRVLVEPGDWVEAGQAMAVIERSVQSEQANSLAASIAVARADAALAQSELDRARALVKRGFISKADIDRKTAARDAAAAARVAVAQAQFGEARARIGRLDIRSPARGLVLTRAVEPGQVVGPSDGALFRVAKDGEMELKAELAEQSLAQLKVGVPADVTPVGTTRSFRGSVWQLSPVIDPKTRQGVARIKLSFDPALRPGGFASANIMHGQADVPLLPESAVQSDEKGNFVYVLGGGDRVVRRDVRIGAVSDNGIAILGGLSGKERVVLSAGAFLNPGDKVIPQLQRAPR